MITRHLRFCGFQKNSTRSGRLQKRTAADAFGETSGLFPALPTDEPLDAPPSGTNETDKEKQGDDDDSNSHITTDSSSDSEPETSVKPAGMIRSFDMPDKSLLWVHKKLRTRHLTFKGYDRTFVCGRILSEAYELSGRVGEFDAPRCRQCFNSKLI